MLACEQRAWGNAWESMAPSWAEQQVTASDAPAAAPASSARASVGSQHPALLRAPAPSKSSKSTLQAAHASHSFPYRNEIAMRPLPRSVVAVKPGGKPSSCPSFEPTGFTSTHSRRCSVTGFYCRESALASGQIGTHPAGIIPTTVLPRAVTMARRVQIQPLLFRSGPCLVPPS